MTVKDHRFLKVQQGLLLRGFHILRVCVCVIVVCFAFLRFCTACGIYVESLLICIHCGCGFMFYRITTARLGFWKWMSLNTVWSKADFAVELLSNWRSYLIKMLSNLICFAFSKRTSFIPRCYVQHKLLEVEEALSEKYLSLLWNPKWLVLRCIRHEGQVTMVVCQVSGSLKSLKGF